MKAHVTIRNYGNEQESTLFCEVFNRKTLFHAYYIPATILTESTIIITVGPHEIGQLFSVIQADDTFNWIEYTVQFEL